MRKRPRWSVGEVAFKCSNIEGFNEERAHVDGGTKEYSDFQHIFF